MTNFYFCLFSVSSKSPFQTHQHLSTSPCCILLPLRTDYFSSLGSTGASQTAWPEVQTWARPLTSAGLQGAASTSPYPYSVLQALNGLRDGIFQGWCLSVASTSCWICYQPSQPSEPSGWLVSSSDTFLHKSKVFWPHFQEVQNTPLAFHFPSSI